MYREIPCKKSIMKKTAIFITFIILVSPFMGAAQNTKAQIKNVNFELVNDDLIITYDIIKFKPGEKFNVWIDVYTALENKIEARSLTGDVNDNVTGGDRKKIIWVLKKDNVQLDNNIYIVVSAHLQIDAKAENALKSAGTASMGKWLLLSSAYPGWGNYKIHQKKAWWLMGAAAYGLVASSVIFNRTAVSRYNDYKVSTNTDNRNDLYSSAVTNKQLSTVFIAAAGAVWVADLTWLMIKGKKKGVSLGYKYNPAMGKPLLSARVTF